MPDTLPLIRDLQELIEAIDRRSRHFDRSGEAEIADDARQLRVRALDRIAELEALLRRTAVTLADRRSQFR